MHFLSETMMGIFWTCWVANLLLSGLSLPKACLAGAAWYLAVGLFELPTGIIADRYGKKNSTLLGLGGMSLSFLSMPLFDLNSLGWFFIALAGISQTFLSGAKNSWLFHIAKNKDVDFCDSTFWSNLDLLGRIGMLVGAFLGAKLTGIDPTYAWIAACALGTLSLGVGLASKDDGAVSKAAVGKMELGNSYQILAAIFPLLLCGVFFSFEAGIRNIIYQPFVLKISSGEIMYLAWFQSSLSIARLLGNLFYKKWFLGVRTPKLFAALALLLFAAGEVVAWISTSFIQFVPLYLLGVFALGWYFPIAATLFNRNVPDSTRATWLSVESLVANICAALGCLFIWGTLEGENIQGYWLFGSGALLVASLFLGLYRESHVRSASSPQLRGEEAKI